MRWRKLFSTVLKLSTRLFLWFKNTEIIQVSWEDSKKKIWKTRSSNCSNVQWKKIVQYCIEAQYTIILVVQEHRNHPSKLKQTPGKNIELKEVKNGLKFSLKKIVEYCWSIWLCKSIVSIRVSWENFHEKILNRYQFRESNNAYILKVNEEFLYDLNFLFPPASDES